MQTFAFLLWRLLAIGLIYSWPVDFGNVMNIWFGLWRGLWIGLLGGKDE